MPFFIIVGFRGVTLAIVIAVLLHPQLGVAADPVPDAHKLLREMVTQQEKFDPAHLNTLGVDGLNAVLDELLPDTVQPSTSVNEEQIAILILQLGHDTFAQRNAAQEKLQSLAPTAARKKVNRAAKQNANPEIRDRAKAIVQRWEDQTQKPLKPYVAAFERYVLDIKDEKRLKTLAGRTLRALEAGMPKTDRMRILSTCLQACVMSKQDSIVDELRPVLDANNKDVAKWVTHQIGMLRVPRYMPNFLIEALSSEHPQVVDTAMRWVPSCWDQPKQKPLREALVRIFEGDNVDLKFQACFPLMHDFRDPIAMEYLLEIASAEGPKRRTAVGWIGDARNTGTAASQELLEVLLPLLKSKDDRLRRTASNALGTYSGKSVSKHLVEMLGDGKGIVVREAGYLIKSRIKSDRAHMLKLLAEAAENHENARVRQSSKALLAELRKEPK